MLGEIDVSDVGADLTPIILDKWSSKSIFDGENVGSYPKKPFNIGAYGPRIPNSNFWAISARDSLRYRKSNDCQQNEDP